MEDLVVTEGRGLGVEGKITYQKIHLVRRK